VRHHVAPMTRGITNREKDRFVFPTRPGKGFLTPGIPINRVVSVLEKVRRFFLRQAIRMSNFSGDGCGRHSIPSLPFRAKSRNLSLKNPNTEIRISNFSGGRRLPLGSP
jgi:hypothetical protein